MNKLTNEEKRLYDKKKNQYMLTNSDLATMLNAKTEDVFRCSIGQEVHPEVYEAVKEWIAE